MSSPLIFTSGDYDDLLDKVNVTIPDNYTSIGEYAFSGATSLSSITFGVNSLLNRIGDNAFLNATSLTFITIPSSVTSIGTDAFLASGLENIFAHSTVISNQDWTINSGITVYGANNVFVYNSEYTTAWTTTDTLSVNIVGTFNKYDSISKFGAEYNILSVYIGTNVTSIGDNAFQYATSLNNVTIPNTVTSIGDDAFSGAEGLTIINIPNSVTTIGDRAFYGATSLTSITIPASVTSIGTGAFSGAASLTLVDVDVDNTEYASVDGVLFDKQQLLLIKYPEDKSDTSYTIPNTVTSIGDDAFSGVKFLTSIDIPDGVSIIGDGAFRSAGSLTSITIPDGVAAIGVGVFANTPNLTTVTIPNSVTSIGDDAFSYAISLTSITIPDLVASIGDRAFQNTSSLISINIPSSVTSIGVGAFTGAESLTSVDVDGDNTEYTSVDGVLFDKQLLLLIKYPEGNPDTSYTIPNTVTSIGSSAFRSATSLTSITIPNSVITIGDNAFQNTSFTSITIPNSVITIGEDAFRGVALTSINIPNSVTSIGEGAFYRADRLTTVTFEKKSQLTALADDTFYDATSLTSITIPRSVTSLGEYLFYDTESLTTVTIEIGSNLTTIGSTIFSNSGVTTVYAPQNVISGQEWTIDGSDNTIGDKGKILVKLLVAPVAQVAQVAQVAPQPIPRMDSGMRIRMLRMNATNLGKVNKSRGNEETGTVIHNNINSRLQMVRNRGNTVPKKVTNRPTI